jgi:hypothetical protein
MKPETTPPVRTFRRLLQRFVYAVKPNWLYRRMLYLAEYIYCILTCKGEIYTKQVTVTPTLTLLRQPDLMARKTIIANVGEVEATPAGTANGCSGNVLFVTLTAVLPAGSQIRVDGFVYTVQNETTTEDTLCDLVEFPGDNYDGGDGEASGAVNGETIEIVNIPGVATIYENGKIVAVIEPGQSRELQLSGRFMIEAKSNTSGTTTLVISTYRRCECGDEYIPVYGEEVEPIGGDLI